MSTVESRKIIEEDSKLISSLHYYSKILNAFPVITAILNPEKQIVFSNKALIDTVGVESLEQILGLKHGEALKCKNSELGPHGCGTSDACNSCGAVNAIIESQWTHNTVVKEFFVTTYIGGRETSFDFQITASPFHIQNKQFIIVMLKDISNGKRRKALERIFFHDVLNSAGTLHNSLELMKDSDNLEEVKKYLHIAEISTHSLIEEIESQRLLVAAENNELIVSSVPLTSRHIIESLVEQIRGIVEANNRNIVINENCNNVSFKSDKVLLKRVLINMLKNALEATPENGKINIGCELNNGSIIFSVHNDGLIPYEVQRHLFERSYTTKGNGRGLGTYSMKLIGERYLGGNVYFESNNEVGTRFLFRLLIYS
jgi:nitrogen-specific signal transduction histidine kinase